MLPPAGEVRFLGPGLVHLEGDLVVTGDEGGQQATSLDLRSGPYDLVLTPVEGGRWTVSGTIDSTLVGDLILGSARLATRSWSRPWS